MVKAIIDTNLLILYLVGSYRIDLLSSCDFTSSYSKDDFHLLETYILRQSAIIVTPQIIAELSNQSFFLSEPGLSEYFKTVVSKLEKVNEKYIPLNVLLKNITLLPKIGFTDLSIYELAKKRDFVVLTGDHALHRILSSQKMNTLSFDHIRGGVWFS